MNHPVFQSVNPATSELLASYPVHTPAQIDRALSLAEKSFRNWRLSSFRERSLLLQAIARSIRKHMDAAAKMATREMGKPIQQSRAELEKCAATFEYYAREAPGFLKDIPVETSAHKSYISYQPLGVVLAIMPWNFPYWQVFRAMAPILASGNTMLLKHASNVSGCALMIEKIVKDAGVPAGLFRSLLVPSAQVADLIAAPQVSAVTFTGSTLVGKQVAAIAASHLKKQVLELGGSDAYVVLEDADIPKTVDICLDARMINTGQSCVAAKRFIVCKKIFRQFEQLMLEKVKALTWGDPMDEHSKIGPMARVDLRDDLHRQVQQTIAQGARLLAGGYVPDGPGAYYTPTLLSKVKKGMLAYEEELFGPVALMIEARDEADAIRIANDTAFGLGAAIFSKNRKKAEQLARQELQSGGCFVNAALHSDPRLPFGGIKHSGYGRELSMFALYEFSNIKTISVN